MTTPQLTMLLAGLWAGERLRPLGWLGMGLAGLGLVLLVAPGGSAPPTGGAVLMIVAGIAWGLYSLRGRGTAEPLRATATSFLIALPIAALVGLPLLADAQLSPLGIGLALASGAIASALGYVIWYQALPGLTATAAATVQLSISVLAVGGGAWLFAEAITGRMLAAAVAVLGGLTLVFCQPAVSTAAPVQPMVVTQLANHLRRLAPRHWPVAGPCEAPAAAPR